MFLFISVLFIISLLINFLLFASLRKLGVILRSQEVEKIMLKTMLDRSRDNKAQNCIDIQGDKYMFVLNDELILKLSTNGFYDYFIDMEDKGKLSDEDKELVYQSTLLYLQSNLSSKQIKEYLNELNQHLKDKKQCEELERIEKYEKTEK